MDYVLRAIKGQIALPYILLVGGVIVEIAIAGVLITYFTGSERKTEEFSLRAESVARSALNDMMARIGRDKEYLDPTSCFLSGSDKTKVYTSRVVNPSFYEYDISAVAVSGGRYREFSAKLIIHRETGRSQLRSITERPVSLLNDC